MEIPLSPSQPAAGIESDAIPFPVTAKSTLCVSLYFSDYTQMQSAVYISGPLSKGYFSLGDQTNAPALALPTSKTTSWFYFLSNISILTAQENHTVICYGDSITAQSWPDYLTLRLQEAGITDTAVIRRAASGTRILRQYDCITYDSYGLKGSNRFHHEVPTEGARHYSHSAGNQRYHPPGGYRHQSIPSHERSSDGRRTD